jgi:thiamine biosynthesis lipoprotein
MNSSRITAYVLLFALAVLVFAACSEKPKEVPLTGRYYAGILLGKPYSIDVVGDSTDYRASLDSILAIYESLFNAQDPNSIISKINAHADAKSVFTFEDSTRVFGLLYDGLRDLHRYTMQYYDPTTAPLKRAWLLTKSRGELEPNIDSLYEFIGFERSAKGDVLIDLNELTTDGYRYEKSEIRKTDSRVELDFSTVAAAAALDAIGAFLTEREVGQFRISFGRSVICGGSSMVDTLQIVPMGIGYDTADQYIRLTAGAYAVRTAHDKLGMIDPTYGYPVSNEMVLVAIAAPSLVEAEVFSEAFMIMGLDRASDYYTKHEDSKIQSFMLYEKDEQLQSASTEGFDRIMLQNDSLPQP